MIHTPETLIAFEDDIAAEFERGSIRSPIHLSGGCEEPLIGIFRDIKPWDWVLGGWRSHYLCLLKGVPPEKVKLAILAGRSVSLCFPDYKIFCSGICGGIAPIATGLAWAMKQRDDYDPSGHTTRVHCFLGDMSAYMGIVHESIRYSVGHNLPVKWYIDDNGKSVATDTLEAWGAERECDVAAFRYGLTRAHCGIGKWVKFRQSHLAS